MMMMTVITWKTPSDARIDITPAQERMLKERGVWPKDSRGEEFCSVSRGLHHGYPTYTDQALLALCGVTEQTP